MQLSGQLQVTGAGGARVAQLHGEAGGVGDLLLRSSRRCVIAGRQAGHASPPGQLGLAPSVEIIFPFKSCVEFVGVVDLRFGFLFCFVFSFCLYFLGVNRGSEQAALDPGSSGSRCPPPTPNSSSWAPVMEVFLMQSACKRPAIRAISYVNAWGGGPGGSRGPGAVLAPASRCPPGWGMSRPARGPVTSLGFDRSLTGTRLPSPPA